MWQVSTVDDSSERSIHNRGGQDELDVIPLELRQVSEVDDAVNNGDAGSQGDENM